MPPKRKSDVLEEVIDLTVEQPAKQDAFAALMQQPAAKKARVSDVGEGSSQSSGGKKATGKGKAAAAPKDWREVVLEGEDDEVPIYDDCNDVRRKIRLLQKEPGFKITHWLKDIGDINNNSFQRFMKASGPTGGAGNGTYYAAYVYFEKVRIAQGKKKTAKRERNEAEHGYGMPREDRKGMWVLCAGRR